MAKKFLNAKTKNEIGSNLKEAVRLGIQNQVQRTTPKTVAINLMKNSYFVNTYETRFDDLISDVVTYLTIMDIDLRKMTNSLSKKGS